MTGKLGEKGRKEEFMLNYFIHCTYKLDHCKCHLPLNE